MFVMLDPIKIPFEKVICWRKGGPGLKTALKYPKDHLLAKRGPDQLDPLTNAHSST